METLRARGSGMVARVSMLSGLVWVAALSAGCLDPMPDRAERLTRGSVYYFDGAGGGGLTNWAGGVRRGLLDAGYDGAGELVKWNTGMGVLADQEASVDYKRAKASEAARSIQRYAKEHPHAAVTVIGLSAGTAPAVFTLEALPLDCPVQNVVLLGASISCDYDLTRALQRVRGRMYVFTSQRDAVLAFAVTAAGTADRRTGSRAAGLSGFRKPSPGTAESRAQYAKLAHIQWKPEFLKTGNLGGHTDAVKAPFVQEYIAPLIMDGLARRVPEASPSPANKVRNPDYDRWAAFSPGAWAAFEGEQVIDGVRQPLRIRAQLVSKHEDRLLVERTYVIGDEGETRVQQFHVSAWIDPADHPLTSPGAKSADAAAQTLTVGGKPLTVQVRTVEATGDFADYGRNVSARIAQSESIPGGVAEISLRSSMNEEPYQMRGRVVEYATR